MAEKIILTNVRFHYVHVFSPRPSKEEGKADNYSVCITIPKTDTDQLQKLKAAMQAAVSSGKDRLADKNGNVNMKTLKFPLRDGDEERPGEEGFENCYFMNCNGYKKPGVVDINRQPIIDPDEFYSGCYGAVSIGLYAYNTNGNKGIAAGLNHVMKMRDGERMDGGSSAEQDFAGITAPAGTASQSFDMLGDNSDDSFPF